MCNYHDQKHAALIRISVMEDRSVGLWKREVGCGVHSFKVRHKLRNHRRILRLQSPTSFQLSLIHRVSLSHSNAK